jgi:hypothetical protein
MTAAIGDMSTKAAMAVTSAVDTDCGPMDGKRATAQNANRAAPIAKRKRADVELTPLQRGIGAESYAWDQAGRSKRNS